MSSTPEHPDAPEAEPDADTAAVETVTQPAPDPELLESRDLALAALREITPAVTIGEPAGYRVEADGVVSLRFHTRQSGYPGWFWTVSLARVQGEASTVLEAELLPGEGALLAPDWVPWAVRLAEYHAAQAALAEAAHAEEEVAADDEDLDDVDDLDAADFDDDGSPILHSGDVDGVDIDQFAEADDDFDEEDSEGDEDFDEDDSEGDEDFDDESYPREI